MSRPRFIGDTSATTFSAFELSELKEEIDELEFELLSYLKIESIPVPDVKESSDMMKEVSKSTKAQKNLLIDFEVNDKKLNELEIAKAKLGKEVFLFHNEIKNVQAAVYTQICIVEKRAKLLEKAEELKMILMSKDRDVNEILNHNHHQQVLHAAPKKKLISKIEHINLQLSAATNFPLDINIRLLEKPVNNDCDDLDSPLPTLKVLLKHLKLKTEENEQKLKQYDEKIHQISIEIDKMLLPQHKSFGDALRTAHKSLVDTEKITNDIKPLVEKFNKLESNILEYDKSYNEMLPKLELMNAQNEQIIIGTEKELRTFNEHKEVLSEYAYTLAEVCDTFLEVDVQFQEYMKRLEKLNKVKKKKLSFQELLLINGVN